MGQPLLAAIALQVSSCETLGSPFSAAVLRAIGRSVDTDLAFTPLFAGWAASSMADIISQAVPLRALGALHDLVLAGASPELGGIYPAPGQPWNVAELDAPLACAAREHAARLSDFMRSPPQTNEVRRSACLLGGFLTVAEETGHPLRCLELGSSAGLNQIWDLYRYRLGDGEERGPAASPLTLDAAWTGGPPPNPPWPRVVERRGCDQTPVDLNAPHEVRRLRAYVWADQFERMERLTAAIGLARAAAVRVERADAGEWAAAQARPSKGTATVLFHSIVRQYLSEPACVRLDHAIAHASGLATAEQPFAWLRMEVTLQGVYEVRLTLWPGGEERLLAVAHPHGAEVAWKAAPKA